MKCPNCGSDKTSFTVSVICDFDYNRHWHKIVKEAFRETATKLIGVDWDKAQIYCRDCNYQFKRLVNLKV